MFVEKMKPNTTKSNIISFEEPTGNLLTILSEEYELQNFLQAENIANSKLRIYSTPKKMKIGTDFYVTDLDKQKTVAEELDLTFKLPAQLSGLNTVFDMTPQTTELLELSRIRKGVILNSFLKEIKDFSMQASFGSNVIMSLVSPTVDFRDSLYKQVIDNIRDKKLKTVTVLIGYRTKGSFEFRKVVDENSVFNYTKASALYKTYHKNSFPISHEETSKTEDVFSSMNMSPMETSIIKSAIANGVVNMKQLMGDRGKTTATAVIAALGDSNTMVELKNYDEALFNKQLAKRMQNVNSTNNAIVVPKKRDKAGHTAKIQDFLETYNTKVYEEDLKSIMDSFSNHKIFPLVLTSFNLSDTSNNRNNQQTLVASFKDATGKAIKYTQHIPKPDTDNRTYLIDGVKYTMSNQLLSKPVVKIKPDTVSFTSNYNKTFVTRFGESGLTEGKAVIKEIQRKGNKLKTIDTNNTHVPLSNTIVDILTIGDKFHSVESTEMEAVFLFVDDEDFLKLNETPDYDSKKYNLVGTYKDFIILIDKDTYVTLMSKTGTLERLDFMYIDYVEKMLNLNIRSHYLSIYSRLKIFGKTLPLIYVLMTKYSFIEILKTYNISYRISEESTKIAPTEISIKLANTNLIIDVPLYEQKMLINGLYKITAGKVEIPNTTFEDFTTKNSNVLVSKALTPILAESINLSLDRFIDPITKGLLEDMLLPTDILELFLYINTLLKDRDTKDPNDFNSYRIRAKQETMAGLLYRNLAKDVDIFAKKYKYNKRMKFSQDPNKLIRSVITELPNFEGASAGNPFLEIDDSYSKVSFKGLLGINATRSVSMEARHAHDSQTGIVDVGALTDNDAVGSTKYFSMNASINNARGFMDTTIPESEFINDPSKFLSFNTLNSPFVAPHADSPRRAMASIQSRHMMAADGVNDVPMVRNGYEDVMKTLLSEDYIVRSKTDGKITDINWNDKVITITDKTGKKDLVPFKDKILTNGGAGFSFRKGFSLNDNLKIGSKVTPDTNLAYNDAFFKDGTLAASGKLMYVTLLPKGELIEDAMILSESVAKTLKLNYIKEKEFVLKDTQRLTSFTKIGESVKVNENLATYRMVGNIDESSFALKLDLSELNIDENIGMVTKIPGVVANIKVFYNVAESSLSKVQTDLIKYLSSIDKKELTTGPATRVNNMQGEDIILGRRMNDAFVIVYYVEKTISGKSGSKVTFDSTKGIYTILPDKDMPFNPRTKKHFDLVISSFSVITRMTPNNLYNLYINKIIIELKERMLSSTSKTGKILWGDFLKMALVNDSVGLKSQLADLKKMTDSQFKKFLTSNLHFVMKSFLNPKLNDIIKMSKYFKIPLEERLVVPTSNNVLTNSPVACGYGFIKVLTQIIDKGVSSNHKIDDVNADTGLLSASAKVAQFSSTEALGTYTYNIHNELLPEFFSARADNADASQQMTDQIIKTGSVSQKDINTSGVGQTSKTIAAYFIGAGYANDIVPDHEISIDDEKQDVRYT